MNTSKSNDSTVKKLDELGAALRTPSSISEHVVESLQQNQAPSPTATLPTTIPAWRRHPFATFATPAACLIAVIVFFNLPGSNNQLGPNEALAAALDKIENARTFSCVETSTSIRDGKKTTRMYAQMFKEPNLERVSMSFGDSEEKTSVTIYDYNKRVRLRYVPDDLTYSHGDLQRSYSVKHNGELELTQLETDLRKNILKWKDTATEDLGKTQLNGNTTRLLQGKKNKITFKVWIDPKTDYPLQVQLDLNNKINQVVTISSILIDQPIDDKLFSLAPPEGYTSTWGMPLNLSAEAKLKLLTPNMQKLHAACLDYAKQHDGQYPNIYFDLVPEPFTREKFSDLMTSPENHGKGYDINYTHPSPADTSPNTLVFYERFNGYWPPQGMIGFFADGHTEIIKDQKRFNQLTGHSQRALADKKNSIYGTKLVHLNKIAYTYSVSHDNQYPAQLSDLTPKYLTAQALKTLLAPHGQPDAPPLFRYIPIKNISDIPNNKWGTTPVIYEIYDTWPREGIYVNFLDGHAALITDQALFESWLE